MPLVPTGNNLTTDKIQPGWTYITDGFGLVTASATYKLDWAVSPASITDRGTAFGFAGFTYLKAHKASVSHDSLQYQTIKVDYVGIDPTVNSGAWTNANTSAANGLTAENITTHPNFFTAATGFGGMPLAGLPADFGGSYNDSTLGPPVSRINVVTGKPVIVPSCEGYNGACFETFEGGRFIGFVDPSYPDIYGKTQYLATTTTYSGIIYVSTHQSARLILDYLNVAVAGQVWGPFKLLPDWADTGAGTYGSKNLLSQVNVEEFGTLYKVMYEIRYNPQGWPFDVYRNL